MTSRKVKTRKTSKNRVLSGTPVPAYFLSLTVQNIRSFGPKQLLDLSDRKGHPAQWTVILGDNGVGKTTLLQILSSLVPTQNVQFGKFIKKLPDADRRLKLIPLEKIEDLLYPGVLGLASLLNPASIFNEIHGAGSTELHTSLQVGSRLTSKTNGTKEEHIYIKKVKEKYDFSSILNESLKSFVCFGYGASRRMGETSLSEQAEDSRFASLFSDSADLMNAEEWLLQSNYAAHVVKNPVARKKAEKRRDDIKDVLISLLPDVEDIRFAQLAKTKPTPSVEFKTPYGWVLIKQLSLGYKTLVAWIVDFASRMFERYPESPNPLAEAAVVLVDEIDLHLHPKWQRTLMRYLSDRFPNTQFIATAHSPLVVQAASDANIALLKREGDHVVIENDLKAIHGWRIDQILTSDLFGLESARPPQLDRLLAERTKLLSKAKLTKKDSEELKRIETNIGSLPTGETPEDMEAMDVIRRAAVRLKAQGY